MIYIIFVRILRSSRSRFGVPPLTTSNVDPFSELSRLPKDPVVLSLISDGQESPVKSQEYIHPGSKYLLRKYLGYHLGGFQYLLSVWIYEKMSLS